MTPHLPEDFSEAAAAEFTTEAIERRITDAIAAKDCKAPFDMIAELSTLPPENFAVVVEQIRRGKFLQADSIKVLKDRVKQERPRKTVAGTVNPRDLPIIQTNGVPMRNQTALTIQALQAANKPPTLFARGDVISYVAQDANGRHSVKDATADYMRGRMDRVASYVTVNADGMEKADVPPREVVADFMALDNIAWGLPPLAGITEVPTLRPDGSILDTPGYDKATRLFYRPCEDWAMEPVPETPTKDDVDAAVTLLYDMLSDFPFRESEDRANAMAMLMTAACRTAIMGNVPLAVISAPAPGIGKSLLAELPVMIMTGQRAAMGSLPADDETEVEKLILAMLLNGNRVPIFDNLTGILRSNVLCRAITGVFEGRILGQSRTARIETSVTWIATGNNITFGGDMPRRGYRIGLEAKQANASVTRAKWEHAERGGVDLLLRWVWLNRAALLRALLVIARNWFALDCPPHPKVRLGSFDAWVDLVCGSLHAAGIKEVLKTIEKQIAGDADSVEWGILLSEIFDYKNFGGEWFSPRTLSDHLLLNMKEPNGTGLAYRLSPPESVVRTIDTKGSESRASGSVTAFLRIRRNRPFAHDGETYRLEYDESRRGWAVARVEQG